MPAGSKTVLGFGRFLTGFLGFLLERLVTTISRRRWQWGLRLCHTDIISSDIVRELRISETTISDVTMSVGMSVGIAASVEDGTSVESSTCSGISAGMCKVGIHNVVGG
eukprot:Nitzschia sp. Nitz4//scaffold5_size260463//112479//112914//NITZ4_000978-RA/size260463-snap-gene-0.40-mRNA-1//-1//CDS//3329555328//3273//frame0